MITVQTFRKRKQQGRKISMVTCYDFWSAKILNQSEIDCILVGDSVATVMHGFDSTVHATLDMMTMHVAAVARGATDKFIIADMPFLTCSKGLEPAMNAVQALMQAGATAVKVEGAAHQADLIAHIVEAGVPVMGHIGLTPQSIHNLGGHKVQGKSEGDAQRLINDARRLEQAGCFSIVLECIPNKLGDCVSRAVEVPTIGIGAGPHTDGQVLVLHDLLGANPDFSPKFLRRYANVHQLVKGAIDGYHEDVTARSFPALEETYG
ncbi:MAG: 3-methyl-2-oxobutanoate hydroxymethyltransferase [Proteobacteria bacterium]|jgi:3-methyl-2-oxobutanoate hydroxymethyltransferase|nr:3-methyl-2-oxobutanoate hydroxymethyltransferase [Pseudomonadota bacterium]